MVVVQYTAVDMNKEIVQNHQKEILILSLVADMIFSYHSS